MKKRSRSNPVTIKLRPDSLLIRTLLHSRAPSEPGFSYFPLNPGACLSSKHQVITKLTKPTHETNDLCIARLEAAMAYPSSSQDYNLTAQLITDGLIIGEVPAHLTLKTQLGAVPKNEREWVLDHVTGSGISIEGDEIFVELGMGGNFQIPEITSIVINGSVTCDEELSTGWRYTVSESMDGLDWEEMFAEGGSGLPGRDRPQRFRRPPADTTAPRFDFFADFMGPRDPNEPQPSFGFNFGPRAPRVSVASWDENTGSLLINSTVTFNRGGNPTEMLSSEEWSLGADGKVLSIRQQSTGFRGNKIDITLIYEKQ